MNRAFQKITSGYGFRGILFQIYCLLITRVCYPQMRVVRMPFQLRNRGTFSGGKNLTIGRYCRFDIHPNGHLRVGERVQFNDHCQIACADSVEIHDDVLIASKVFISDHDHDFGFEGRPIDWPLKSKPVIIEEKVWIGNGVSILKGVTIGKESVIAAGAVVTKNFPPRSIIGGVPAKVLNTLE